MKFSISWLKSFVDSQLTHEQLSEQLTMHGLEVEEVAAVAPPLPPQVVVAKVLTLQAHPNADRLKVCQVDVGEQQARQIVCGAPNVAVDQVVACALPGAVLPNGLSIQQSKIRGVSSDGMLCSAAELGLAEESSGLMTLSAALKLGTPLSEALDLSDVSFTLKITPNRADCLSLTGVAREVAAITEQKMTPINSAPIAAVHQDKRTIIVEDSRDCSCYLGRIFKSVNARAATPDWMVQRLERSGLRSISALVDITNYVMLELGQPLHAFDHHKLNGNVVVRRARADEKLVLLNDQEVQLTPDVLLITDEQNVLAMAGIMGGRSSAISDDTTELFLEAAHFSPEITAGRARRYNFSSEASMRYERGVDPGITELAMQRASELVCQICGGEPGPVISAEYQRPLDAPQLSVIFRPQRINASLGVDVPVAVLSGMFERLGFTWEVLDAQTWRIMPPSWRYDIRIEADIIGEVARMYGYQHIPIRPPFAPLKMQRHQKVQQQDQQLRQNLVAAGYFEVINYAFVEEQRDAALSGRKTSAICLANPIVSQQNAMRSTLLGGLLANLSSNLNRKQAVVRIFEMGRCFFRQSAANQSESGVDSTTPARSTSTPATPTQLNADGEPISGQEVVGFVQQQRLAMLAYGPAVPYQWGEKERDTDFYDVKADLVRLLYPQRLEFRRIDHPALHPGRSAAVWCLGKEIGYIGELHPFWLQQYGFPRLPVVVELNMNQLTPLALPNYQPISKYPPVIRDLALVVDKSVAAEDLRHAISTFDAKLFTDVDLFDCYVGKSIGEDKKSLAFRVVMQDTLGTLQDEIIEANIQRLLSYLQSEFATTLRV